MIHRQIAATPAQVVHGRVYWPRRVRISMSKRTQSIKLRLSRAVSWPDKNLPFTTVRDALHKVFWGLY